MTQQDSLLAAIHSPVSILKGNRIFYAWLSTYTVTALIIFSALATVIMANQESIQAVFLAYLFPESWHSLAQKLIHFFFDAQTKVVLASLILSGSIIVTSIFLFPLKEHCSATLENCISTEPKPADFPLWLQALEEAKLLVLYVAAQAVILGIGYYPYNWCSWLSSILGTLFLFFTFGLDFIAPALQRHRTRYIVIIQLLLRFAPMTLLFGALFSAPLLFLGQAILTQSDMTLLELSSLLFIANIFFMVLAVPAGTWLALKLKPQLNTLNKISPNTQRIAYGMIASVFVLGVSFHTLVARSLHHKTQILKCNYDINWSSIEGNFAGFKKVFFGEEETELRFDMLIHNPTAFDVLIEKSRLVIKQNELTISNTQLEPITVPSHQTVTQPITLRAQFDLGNMSIKGLTDMKSGWTAQLEFELLPGIPFMLKLL